MTIDCVVETTLPRLSSSYTQNPSCLLTPLLTHHPPPEQNTQAAGRPVHRTAFTRGAADGSLLFNPFDMQMKNVANTGVLHWGNKLLALYEVGVCWVQGVVCVGCRWNVKFGVSV